MTTQGSPDLLDLAEAVAAGRLRADDAERQVRAALGPERGAASEKAIRELRQLITAASSVRSHVTATREAFTAESRVLADASGSMSTVVPGPVRAGVARRRSSSGSDRRAARRTWLLVAATLLVGGGVIGASVVGGRLATPNPAPTNPNGVAFASASPDASAISSAVPAEASPATQPRSASWGVTGSMGTARLGHVATLLRDGRVLVAGGADKACYCSAVNYASAELYDPATGTWTATGSMVAPHAHTFTLTQLADGRVLAADWPTSDLYDPSTGRWTVTGQMVVDDASANATLLPDGRVLVAGGGGSGSITCNGCAPRSSAELYDPVSGTWAAIANMTRPRSAPTVTLLPNGKVLVAGGDPPVDRPGPPRVLSTAELYDPVTGSWTATGTMATMGMVQYAALLPDGRVLVVGVKYTQSAGAPSAELYDPASGSWAVTGKMVAVDNIDTTTLLLDGKVLATNGSGASQLYDPARGTWTATSSIPPTSRPYGLYTATLLFDGRVLVAGGMLPAAPGSAPGSASVASASAELYDPGSNR